MELSRYESSELPSALRCDARPGLVRRRRPHGVPFWDLSRSCKIREDVKQKDKAQENSMI